MFEGKYQYDGYMLC